LNWIASFFLRAKHWQIFVLLFGVMLVGQVSVMISVLTVARSAQGFGKGISLFWVATVLSMGCFEAWFWSMGSFLNCVVHPKLRLRLHLFRFAIIYPALYVFLFIALFERTAFFSVIFPLHLLAMFCMFYQLYFVSKNLVLAETGRPASFSDYARLFLALWFFPIGIWIVQPRINRLIQKEGGVSTQQVNPESA
jgi:hypothetical protein